MHGGRCIDAQRRRLSAVRGLETLETAVLILAPSVRMIVKPLAPLRSKGPGVLPKRLSEPQPQPTLGGRAGGSV